MASQLIVALAASALMMPATIGANTDTRASSVVPKGQFGLISASAASAGAGCRRVTSSAHQLMSGAHMKASDCRYHLMADGGTDSGGTQGGGDHTVTYLMTGLAGAAAGAGACLAVSGC